MGLLSCKTCVRLRGLFGTRCATQKLVSRLQNELVHLHHPHGKWFLHHDFLVGRVEFRFHAIQTRNPGPCCHLRF